MKTMTINNQVYMYQLNRKWIKNMYMRVKDNQIIVNVPYFTSTKQIETFVSIHIEKLSQHLNHKVQTHYSLTEGYFDLLGKRYDLVFKTSTRFHYQIDYHTIYLFGKDFTEDIIFRLMRELSKDIIIPMFNTILKNHPEFKQPMLCFQRMKTKWGVCYPGKQKVKLNTLLIHQKEELIVYVIYHELVHLFEANHSPAYYLKLSLYLPNYKELRKQLNNRGDVDE